jgi:hypothetical protein
MSCFHQLSQCGRAWICAICIQNVLLGTVILGGGCGAAPLLLVLLDCVEVWNSSRPWLLLIPGIPLAVSLLSIAVMPLLRTNLARWLVARVPSVITLMSVGVSCFISEYSTDTAFTCIPVTVVCIIVLFIRWNRVATPGGKCAKCGYDLRGIRASVCPECGSEVNLAARSDGSVQ